MDSFSGVSFSYPPAKKNKKNNILIRKLVKMIQYSSRNITTSV